MALTEKQLLGLKEKIENAKSQIQSAEGKKEYLLQELADLGCSSVKEAEEKIVYLQENIDELSDKIQKIVEQIEDNYDI